MKKTKSLRYHQSLQFALVAGLPVLMIAILVWLFLLPAMQSDTKIRHQGMARSIAGQVSSNVLGGQRQLAALANFIQTIDGFSDRQLTALLDSQCGEGELFETIYISSPLKQRVMALGLTRSRRFLRRDLIGLDLSGRRFVKAAGIPENPVWSETFMSTVSRRLAVALTIPMSENLITAEITLDNLSEKISQLPGENQFLTYVIDRNGRIVADSQRSNWGQRLQGSLFAFADPEHGGQVISGSFELDGASYLGTVVSIDALGWKVIVAQPASKAYSPLRSTLITFALGLTMASILALFLSWNRAKRLSHIFRAYTEKARAIADGRYDKIWPSSAITELYLLGQSLKHMAGMIDQREKELVKKREAMKNLIANVPGIMYKFSGNSQHPEFNDASTVLKEKVKALLGIHWHPKQLFNDFIACLPKADQSRFVLSVQKAVDAVTPWHYEGRFIKPDGEEIWIECTSQPRSVDKKLVYYGFIMDSTRRKEAEEELRQLKNYLSNIIDSMPSVLVGVDHNIRVTQWNQQARNITGLNFEEAGARHLTEVLPHLADKIEQIKTAIREHRVINAPKIPVKTKQEIRFEDVTIFPLTADGVEGAVIRVDDITEQVRLEEMMIQSEKMLSVGGLAAGMAHEINNPLAAMIQTANVVKLRLENLEIRANLKAAEEVGITVDQISAFMEKRSILRMLDAINESGQRVAGIVGNMLSFARKSESAFSSHHPAQLIDKVLELAATDYNLKKKYDFKTIKIIKEYEKNLPMVPCEAAKIQQVLLNILRNGAQAMQSQDMADNDPPCFILKIAEEKNMLRIEIQDNGPGMDEATQSRIFEPFFTTKPVGKGTGLGLSVSYFIITQNHRGTLDVESSLKKGSNFIIRLPLERE
ncbi:ATP-binding protein [uncultured Desulfobacter sp.]|uniref:ATP-binding protein n=1 Tax=uncultured Desulfobacter sp. TaxID=240139 RepID=UPI002AA89127|nr:ATP-binding protein [uncultured Desulfobacter sp.]